MAALADGPRPRRPRGRAGVPAAARPRRLQAGQRRRRARGRRPPARRRWPRGCAPPSATATWSAGSAATSSPSWSPTGSSEATALAERIVAELRTVRPAPGSRGPRAPGLRLRRLRQHRRDRAATRPTTCRRPSARPTWRCARPRRRARAASRTAGHAIDSAAGRRTRLARDLPAALEQEQFRVVYQPVVGRGRAADPRARGARPLGPPGAGHRAARRVHLPRRGRRPDRGPAALGAAPGDRRRRARCSAAGWDAADRASTSPSATCRPAAWRPTSRAALAESGLPPHKLILEITESVMLDAEDRLESDLATLHEHGLRPVRRRLRPRLLVAGLPGPAAGRHPEDGPRVHRRHRARRARGAALVASVIELGRALGMDVVAEGVETAGQLRALRGHGLRASSRAGCSAGRWTLAELRRGRSAAFDPSVLDAGAGRGNGHRCPHSGTGWLTSPAGEAHSVQVPAPACSSPAASRSLVVA